MFYQNRFTERARQALTLAQEAAASFGHSYIGSEHLLLGLLREGGGPAAKALAAAGVTEDLKARDPMRWVGLINTLKAQAEEIIITEIIME